ncbi:MAG: hypothetical protein EP339_03045 [Gammaproteobacteria bacterium]|nr:MAG: hypothetical protein EP339_03045 [Gammaproteobacteria bacterium]
MSYILDALRKSETERRQGKVPDLGQQVQLIHRPKKKPVSPAIWVALALVINAGVLIAIFWPAKLPGEMAQTAPLNVPDRSPPPAAVAAENAAKEVAPPLPEGTSSASDTQVAETVPIPGPVEESDDGPVSEPAIQASGGNEAEQVERERPTIIVPSSREENTTEAFPEPEFTGRVPHLVELPLSFQKSIPDLTFNSHIYASDPSARRVMINGQYLRVNDRFDGLQVESITEEGVVLSKQGQRFRVGIVRDWVSPR